MARRAALAERPRPTAHALRKWLDLVHAGVHPFNASRMVPGPVKWSGGWRAEDDDDPRMLPLCETMSRIRREAERGLVEGAGEPERAFALAYAAALEEYDQTMDWQVDQEYVRRGLDPERGKSTASNNMLHNLAMTRSRRRGSRLEAYKPLLETRLSKHVHSGDISVRHQIDVSKYSDEELATLQELLARGDAGARTLSNGQPALLELPAGVEPIVDVEPAA